MIWSLKVKAWHRTNQNQPTNSTLRFKISSNAMTPISNWTPVFVILQIIWALIWSESQLEVSRNREFSPSFLVADGLLWVWRSACSCATLWLWTSFSNKAGLTLWTFVSFASESLEVEALLNKDDPQKCSHFSLAWHFCHDGVDTLKHSSFSLKSLSFRSALSLSFISSLSFFLSSLNC